MASQPTVVRDADLEGTTWLALQDPSSGRIYYFDQASNVTQWDKPAVENGRPAASATYQVRRGCCALGPSAAARPAPRRFAQRPSAPCTLQGGMLHGALIAAAASSRTCGREAVRPFLAAPLAPARPLTLVPP